MTPTEKRCTLCEALKPLDDFYVKATGKFGREARCKKCISDRNKANRPARRASENAYYHKTSHKPDSKNRRQSLKKLYGITPEEYEAMLVAQGGVCAICGNPCPTGKRLAVDHCHENGQVRGLLCLLHNQGLGQFDHNPKLLAVAINYLLQSHPGRFSAEMLAKLGEQ